MEFFKHLFSETITATLLGLIPMFIVGWVLNRRRINYRAASLDPFTDQPLRPPGESLRVKIQELSDDFDANFFGAAMITLASRVRMASMGLLKIREAVDDPAILEKIRSILMPTEYTRVDGIIDLVFSATTEVKKEDEVAPDESETDVPTKRFTPVNFREACFERIARSLKITLVKQSLAISTTPDGKTGVYCANSRAYQNAGSLGYWFGFHPGQRDALAQYEKSYVAFGCGSPENILLIPFEEFEKWLPTFNQTMLPDRAYWHVKFEDIKGQWVNHPKAEHARRPVTKYLISDRT